MAAPSISASAPQVDLLDPRQIKALQREAASGSPQALRTAAQQFEAILLTQLLQQMHKPMMPGGMFDTAEAQQWNSIVDKRMGVHMAQQGGIGLADAVLRQIQGGRAAFAGSQDAAAGAVK
jgi:flagellar protein FlgJ